MKRLQRWISISVGLVVISGNPLAAQPVIQSIVTENGATGFGQLITIQGFDLIEAGGIADTTVTFTDKDTGVPCSDVFLFDSPSTANELYVRLHVVGGPCDIPDGKYKVTVDTPAGTSNEVGFQVKAKPHAPIPRQLFFPGDPACPVGAFGHDICVQASGTDTSSINAVFSQGGAEFPSEPLIVTFSSDAIGLVNAFEFPAGLVSGDTALVQLRTTVDGVASDLSFAMVFEVP